MFNRHWVNMPPSQQLAPDEKEKSEGDGITPLYMAAQNGDLADVEKLLTGLDPQDRLDYIKKAKNDGATPLFIAAQQGHFAVVEKLLEGLSSQDRLDCLKQTMNGATPLLVAAENGHLAVIEKLLADLNPQDRLDYIKQAVNDDITPLYMAAQNGHHAVVEKLLEDLNLQDRLGYLKQTKSHATPLLVAAENGHFAVVEKLLAGLSSQDRLGYLKLTSENGVTPLFMAAQFGFAAVVEKLLAGLKPQDRLDCLKQTNRVGATPLFMAAQFGFTAVVEKLLAGLNPQDQLDFLKQKIKGVTPLFMAARNGHFDTVKKLCACALNLDIVNDGFTSTLKHLKEFAAQNNVLPTARKYLAEIPCDGNGMVNITPGGIATMMGHTEIANYLLHQNHLAETGYIYEYARNVDKHITCAMKNGWPQDFVQTLNKHKEAIIDPEQKIGQTIEEQQMKLRKFKEEFQKPSTQRPVIVSPSSHFGASKNKNKAIKMQFLAAIESTMNEFQMRSSGQVAMTVH